MPEFKEVISPDKMARDGKASASQQAYDDIVSQVPDGQAGVITISPNDGMRRAVKTKLRYAARRAGRLIIQFRDDGMDVQFEMGKTPK